MTPENAKKLLPIITAYAEGKTIQLLGAVSGVWLDISDPMFQGEAEHYRIKPEPLEVWVNVYRNGLVGKCYSSKEGAIDGAGYDVVRVALLREVTE